MIELRIPDDDRCMDCANFVEETKGKKGGVIGSCKFRSCPVWYKDKRYGRTKACKKIVRKAEFQ